MSTQSALPSRPNAALTGLVVCLLLATGAAPAVAGTPAAADHPPRAATSMDIDGDGRADRTTLTTVRSDADYVYVRLVVSTARGVRATKLIRVPNDLDLSPTAETVWVGAAAVDGVHGGEIVLDLGGGSVGDWPQHAVYTLRGNTLRTLRAPGEKADRTPWTTNNLEYFKAGYSFSTRSGVRRVIVNRFTSSDMITYAGTRTTYRWARAGWVKVGTQRLKNVSARQAAALSGLNGLAWR